MDSKLMVGYQRTLEVEDYHCLKIFPKQDLIFANHMLIAWWIHFLELLVHFVLQTGAVDHVMVTTTSLMELGYPYARYRLNNSPDIVITTINIVWLSTQTASRIARNPALKGIDHYLNRLNHATVLTRT